MSIITEYSARLRTALKRATGSAKAVRAWLARVVPDGRDAHGYAGLCLVGWGLWHSPCPWAAGVVVGAVLWWMGVFMGREIKPTNRG